MTTPAGGTVPRMKLMNNHTASWLTLSTEGFWRIYIYAINRFS